MMSNRAKWVESAPMSRADLDTILARSGDAIRKAKAVRDEADSKVFEFDGTALQFKAAMERHGVEIVPGRTLNASMAAAFGLEVVEVAGRTYVGTSAALKRAIPFLVAAAARPPRTPES